MNPYHSNQSVYKEIEIPFPNEIFIGNGLSYHIKGWVYSPGRTTRTVEIRIGSVNQPMDEIKQPRTDVFNLLSAAGSISSRDRKAIYSGFSGCFDLNPILAGKTIPIRIVATFTCGFAEVIDQRMVSFKTREDVSKPIQTQRNSSNPLPHVAICMATYNPDIDAFTQQIDSIRRQTYTNWICIVCDDCSSPDTQRSIQDVLSGDLRFFFIKHETNLGYYRNFERALYLVPAETEFVALSDQDDYWYSDKIEQLVNRIQEDRKFQLVYSDMRIVSKDGQTISDTYWRKRKNHYRDIRMVMVCGTVTGAASLFKRELLNIALPFTQDTGNAFHDHLISCAALAVGKIGYIDKPLYDYIQHDINVIGHHEFENEPLAGLILKDLKTLSRLKLRLKSLYQNYDINYIRLCLIARSMLLRIGKPVSRLKAFDNTWLSVIRLFFLHIQVRMEKKTTENAEIVIVFSYIARKVYKFFLIIER